MAEISEYERIRLKNIEENRRMLCQLGLLSEDWKPPIPKVFKPGIIKKPVKKRTKVENGDPLYLPGRRSLRTSHSNDTDDSDFTDSINGEYSGSENGKEKLPKRPNVYGEIEDVHVGDVWDTRIECSRAGVHRPTVAGIHPGPDGAYSIALSGGYEDNYDGGDSFTYTGAGGRDLKGTKDKPKNLRTGPQVKDQTLDGANGSLATSVETRKPVRVIRGYKSSSAYAPDFGYRYDGLYQVENYWTAKGVSGHLVYKFALKRCSDQEPPPWITDNETDTSKVEESPENIAVDTDETSKKALTSSAQAGKKVSDGELNLQTKTENVSGGSINGSIHSPNVDKAQTDKLTPEKCNVIDKTVSSGSSSVSKSQKKISSKNSPLKVKSTSVSDSPYKSPVKMIASNQSLDEVTKSKDNNTGVSLNDNVQKPLDDSSQKTAVTQEISDSDFSVSSKIVPENGKLVSNDTSPDIFEGSSPGYLKSRNRENPFIFGRNRGVKRSPSPDDFAKICDELCNDLPKIEKVKRLRFSFDNYPDDDLQINTSKTRRKRMSHTPRKSSLIVNRGVKDNYNQNGCDLLFSKYIEICLTKFSFSENDYLGWDDYSSEFEGWTDKEVNEAKKYTSSFSDFIFKCHENNSFSSADENGWAGWEDVPRRSLILNGFLLDEISRNRKSCDSDGTDVTDEFLGFQQEVVN